MYSKPFVSVCLQCLMELTTLLYISIYLKVFKLFHHKNVMVILGEKGIRYVAQYRPHKCIVDFKRKFEVKITNM